MKKNENISNEIKKQKIAKKLLLNFIVIMIILTIISKIFNSIITPTVYVENISGGTVTKKITANGIVKADEEININFKELFLVDKIYYGIGEEVKVGQPLIKFDKNSVDETLKTLQTELKKLELQLQKMELDNTNITKDKTLEEAQKQLETLERDKNIALKKENDKITNSQNDIIQAENELKEKQQELFNAKQDYENAKKELLKDNEKIKQDKIKEAEEAIEKLKKDLDDKTYEKNKALQKAEEVIKDAKDSLFDVMTGEYLPQNEKVLKNAEMEYQFIRKDFERILNDINEQIKKANKDLEEIKNTPNEELNKKELATEEEKIKQAESSIKQAEQNIKDKQKLLEDANYNKELSMQDYDIKIQDANENIEDSKVLENENKIKVNNDAKKQNIDKEILKLDINAKKEQITKLNSLIRDNYSIKANIDGIISSINAKEGEKLQNENLISIIPNNTKYIFEVFLPQEEAEIIEKEDLANIELSSNTLKDIPINKILDYVEEDKTGKIIEFLLEDAKPNSDGKMEIIKESNQFNNIVPKEAIRTESNSEYVLVTREKNTMLGKQTLAVKVDIKKLEEGDRTVAVEGAFEPNDKLIIDSNKQINENDTVRIGEK